MYNCAVVEVKDNFRELVFSFYPRFMGSGDRQTRVANVIHLTYLPNK